jgi:hypothetical protein
MAASTTGPSRERERAPMRSIGRGNPRNFNVNAEYLSERRVRTSVPAGADEGITRSESKSPRRLRRDWCRRHSPQRINVDCFVTPQRCVSVPDCSDPTTRRPDELPRRSSVGVGIHRPPTWRTAAMACVREAPCLRPRAASNRRSVQPRGGQSQYGALKDANRRGRKLLSRQLFATRLS